MSTDDSPSGLLFFSYGHGVGCPAAEHWERWWIRVTLPLVGPDLAAARETLAAYTDPDEPQGDEGDCAHCVAQVERLAAEVERAEGSP